MGPKKAIKNVRKIIIKFPTDTPTEFDLGDTAAEIQKRWEERTEGGGRGGRETTGRRGRDRMSGG